MGMANTRPRTNLGMLERYAPDIITNGTFDADSDWTKGDGWDINATTAGKAHCDGSQGAASSLTQASISGLTVNEAYKIIFTLSGYSAGAVRPYVGSGGASVGTWRAANNTYTEEIVCTGSPNVLLYGSDAFIGDIDDVILNQKSLS